MSMTVKQLAEQCAEEVYANGLLPEQDNESVTMFLLHRDLIQQLSEAIQTAIRGSKSMSENTESAPRDGRAERPLLQSTEPRRLPVADRTAVVQQKRNRRASTVEVDDSEIF